VEQTNADGAYISVIPMKMGIYFEFKNTIWIPACAGMTVLIECSVMQL
jgi:hypothetical protein